MVERRPELTQWLVQGTQGLSLNLGDHVHVWGFVLGQTNCGNAA